METKNKTILKNSVFLYFRMLVLMALSIFTSREILRYLGIVDYGIYDIISGVIGCLSFLSTTLTSSTQRFLNVSKGAGELHKNKVFSTCFYTHLGLAVVLLLLIEVAGVWFLNNKLTIPEERMNAAFWVLHISSIAACVGILNAPFNAAIIANERMNIFSYITIIDAVGKLLVIYCLSNSFVDKLILYALLLLLIQLLVFGAYVYYSYKSCNIRKIKVFERTLLKEIGAFVGWTSYGGLALIGYTQGLNILLNIFFGPSLNAARGVAVRIESMVKQFRNNFQVAVTPQLMQSYTDTDKSRFITLFAFSCKFSTFIILIMISPLLFRVDWLLSIWLVEVPEYTAIFIKLLLLTALVDSSIAPFASAIQANGNIKWNEIVNGTLLLLIVPVSYIALRSGLPPYSVFVVYLAITILTHIVRIAIFSRQINMPYFNVLDVAYTHITRVFCIDMIILYALNNLLPVSHFFTSVFYITSVIATCIVIYYLGLKKNERIRINGYIISKIRK